MTEDGDKLVLTKRKIDPLERMHNGIACGIVFFDVLEFQHNGSFRGVLVDMKEILEYNG